VNITTTHRRLPNRMVLHAVEGWGKTSFGAQIPGVLFLTAGGEDGLDTLVSGGLVAPVPHNSKPCATAAEFRGLLTELAVKEHPYRCLAVDTMNALERLVHQQVCTDKYKGDWGERGFAAFNHGYAESLHEWLKVLIMLDHLREVRNMSILMLTHTRPERFQNPDGPDYDRWMPAVHKTTWDATQQWADIVLYGSIETFVAVQGKAVKGKAQGGSQRLLQTERSASVVAKNRHNLPRMIDCGHSAAEAWTAFRLALSAARNVPETPRDVPREDPTQTFLGPAEAICS